MMTNTKTELSGRLSTIASFVRSGSRIADIGTDHGFLPIALIQRGIAESAVAMDVREGPLSRARAHVMEAGLADKIDLRLGDGLEKLKPGEADTVIIAGMGGPLILEILRSGGHVTPQIERFILSPQSDWRGFRAGLSELSLAPVREAMVYEEGKYYLILEAVHTKAGLQDSAERDVPPAAEGESGNAGIPLRLSERYGRLLLENRDPVLKDYLLWQKNILSKIRHTLSACGADNADKRKDEVEEELAAIEDALQFYPAKTDVREKTPQPDRS